MSLLDLRRGAEKWMQNLVVRMVVAALCLLVHVHFFQRLGEERFKRPFNNAPTSAPMFHDKVHEGAASHWDRLLVSRWDAQHYQGLALRGYETCKTRETLKPGQHPDDDPTCELSFYPTYGWLGRAVVKLTGLPIDYALFALSLACSLVFLTMLTGPLIVRPLGVWGAYLAMFLFNAFTTGFTLVTVQTEPCLLLLMILSLWLMDKRYIWAGAVVAGAATAIRITGVAVGFAYCAGLAVLFVKEGPSVRKALGTLVKMLVSGWGIIALLLYFAYKFGDPLIYSHAHGRSFNHTPGIARIFFAPSRRPQGSASSSCRASTWQR